MTDPAFDELMERYDNVSASYTDLWAPILRKGAQPLVRALGGEGVGRVLDAGTGVGAQLGDLSDACPGAVVIASDASRGMLALVPGRYPRLRLDAQKLPLRSASLDRVSFVFMLFHLDHPVLALREAKRVLRPGGRVGALTWGGEFESPASRVWAECLDAYGAVPADPAKLVPDDRLDTPEKMDDLLRAGGFTTHKAWSEELVHDWPQEEMLRQRRNMGAYKPRWESLAPDAQKACLADARGRMGALPSEAFVARCELVYGIASV
jgi:SAM-dependent methyltransferase